MIAPNHVPPGGEGGAGDLGRSRRVSQVSFGALLKRHRGAAGISQEELAARAGVGVRTISDLEREVTRWPYPSTVTLLAEALQVDEAQRAALESAARRPSEANAPSRPALPIPRADPGPSGYLTLLPGGDRDDAVTEYALRRREIRLLTHTGPDAAGAIGLAIQVAASHAALLPDGIVVVPLVSLDDSALAPDALAGAADLEDAAGPLRVNGPHRPLLKRRGVGLWGWYRAGRARWYRQRVRRWRSVNLLSDPRTRRVRKQGGCLPG